MVLQRPNSMRFLPAENRWPLKQFLPSDREVKSKLRGQAFAQPTSFFSTGPFGQKKAARPGAQGQLGESCPCISTSVKLMTQSHPCHSPPLSCPPQSSRRSPALLLHGAFPEAHGTQACPSPLHGWVALYGSGTANSTVTTHVHTQPSVTLLSKKGPG